MEHGIDRARTRVGRPVAPFCAQRWPAEGTTT